MELLAIAIITEVMYNPASNESMPNDVEWVEIYNPTDEPLDISGWHLADEDGATAGLPDGTILASGTAAVLIPADQTVEDFQAAWGEGFDVYALDNWGRGGLFGLGNDPSAENEVLTLRDADGNVVDEVNYDDQDDWPSDSPDGPSIYLAPDALYGDANDHGGNWKRSAAGTDGAFEVTQTDDFTSADVGSPGVIASGELAEEG